MADSRDPRRSVFAVWHWPRWTWAIILPLMIVSYPLSIGPAARIHWSGYLPREAEIAIEAAYWPLESVVRESEFAGAVVEWYVELWIGL